MDKLNNITMSIEYQRLTGINVSHNVSDEYLDGLIFGLTGIKK